MRIQSLSICVPGRCPNKCRFCVARMHHEYYKNQIEKNKPFRRLYKEDYKTKLAFARDNGCNTLMFTGTGEPLANQSYLEMVGEMNRSLEKPFRMIELQTSGIFIKEPLLRWLRNDIQVNTISLSLSSFNSHINSDYNVIPVDLRFLIVDICKLIKIYDFNLRLSLNMTDEFDKYSVAQIFDECSKLGADQVTFRKLYHSPENDKPQDKWISTHLVKDIFWIDLNNYIKFNGRKLEKLPFGATRYSVNEMSVVVDEDCMSTETKEEVKYLIMRENCKLYTKWNDKGSLLF